MKIRENIFVVFLIPPWILISGLKELGIRVQALIFLYINLLRKVCKVKIRLYIKQGIRFF